MLPHVIDRNQVEHEARAKIFWGDPPEEVTKFLMMQGVHVQEASQLVQEMFLERAATIRGIGMRKILMGIPLICIPIGAWFYFASIKILPVKIFALTVMAGLWGAWLLLKGCIMFFFPKSEPGDVADQ
jgi:hypothetical protein